MSKIYVLYNPMAGDQSSEKVAKKMNEFFSDDDFVYTDLTSISDYHTYFADAAAEDKIVLCGGDGTLNRFINNTHELNLNNAIYFYATGSGNDFLRDIDATLEGGPVQINRYIKNLPTVEVNGKTYRFINGVGYGIDGYCCEVGDEIRKQGKKPNYTSIAIKGLLFHYNATKATVTVDGIVSTYNKVWIAPTMFGRYYGGGMMAAPNQDRNDPSKGVSVLLMHNAGRIGTLCVFPSIFKGEHVKHEKTVTVQQGHGITVEFDRPVTLQIDGETVFNVSKYRVRSAVSAK